MKLKFIKDSYLKPNTSQSSTIKPELLKEQKSNSVLELDNYKTADNNHLKVQLKGNSTVYYAFVPHIQLITDEGKVYVEPRPDPKTGIQQTATKIPDNKYPGSGKQITIPGIGIVYLNQSIIPNGNFTWAEATHDGSRIPTKEHAENIKALASKLEDVRKVLGNRSMHITSWYRPEPFNYQAGGVSNSQHLYGGAVDFWVEGENGYTLRQKLDSMWKGGLGIYTHIPDIIHLDDIRTRGYTARWP